ncbi:MAG: NADH-quinone oxidoreductase subunit C [bacterium]|nr:NADH-quinone oxidoreductase subunit C [Deltaproteobacteria bacterium]MCP4906594.1 NADH-quinone oxidoreductase subunit C [bacterium]
MSGLDPNVLRTRHRDLEIDVAESSGPELRVSVSATQARALLVRLRDEEESAMKRLVDLTAIDRGEGALRFEVVYRLQSIERDASLRVHAHIPREVDAFGVVEPVVDSVTSIWSAANWLEREVYDLFGIRFKGHPDLRRLLLDDGFEGAPLRKDHPLQVDRALPPEGEG